MVLWVGPFAVGVFGGGFLAIASGVLEAADADPYPAWTSVTFSGILLMVQVLAAARVVNDYWLPRWFEIVFASGKPVRPDGLWELLLMAIPPAMLTLAAVLPVIEGDALPEGREWLLYSGAFLIIVPTALHRAIERKRFPDMRVGDSVMP